MTAALRNLTHCQLSLLGLSGRWFKFWPITATDPKQPEAVGQQDQYAACAHLLMRRAARSKARYISETAHRIKLFSKPVS
jgi:hypothetical protein